MKCIKCGTVHNDEVCPHCGFENVTSFDLPKLKDDEEDEEIVIEKDEKVELEKKLDENVRSEKIIQPEKSADSKNENDDFSSDESVEKREKIVSFILKFSLITVSILLIVFTLFYGANEAKRMNDDEVKSIESNINFYFETEKESVINDLLSDTKNNIDKLDNTQNVVKETCLKSINDFIGKDYENKFTYEETYKNRLNLLEKLYLTTIKSGTKEIRLLSKKDYEEVKKEFEDKYNHGNYYYIAVDLYNSKDYNEAYLNFQRITKENIYYDRAIEKSNLIIDNVMQLLEKDILSMNENIDKLSLDEKLKRYNQIDKVIKDYDDIYFNLNLSSIERYTSIVETNNAKILAIYE